MSTDTGRKRPVILPEIVWVRRSRDTEYGMMGNIKAFSIWLSGNSYRLNPRLPDRTGVAIASEEFKSPEKARERAEAIREEWRKDLATPYEGQFKQVS
ncbi:hypothetical protein [Nonomuraea basaltis]|uniref:hypothetical protein n=1 Tax=Nonomuraea basaltis TaxID=2495887 RepID=UPI00110C4171|nr:hypothetical protein [Nonomuraea basaltis]TMR98882.1 hypothetical protein EJK15_10080 [Nonomuraea basaltis]